MELKDNRVTIEELAEVLEKSPAYLKRHWLTLHLKKGLPRKLAIGWLWPRAPVEAWLQGGSGTRLAPASLAANQNAALAKRYGGARI